MAVKIQSIPNKLHHSPAGMSSPLISLLFHPPLVRPPLPLSLLSPFSLLFVSRQQGNGGLSRARERERETGRQRDSELLLKLWRQLCQECRCLLWGQQSEEDLRRSAAWASSTSVWGNPAHISTPLACFSCKAVVQSWVSKVCLSQCEAPQDSTWQQVWNKWNVYWVANYIKIT